jgi:hypothetical protein
MRSTQVEQYWHLQHVHYTWYNGAWLISISLGQIFFSSEKTGTSITFSFAHYDEKLRNPLASAQ